MESCYFWLVFTFQLLGLDKSLKTSENNNIMLQIFNKFLGRVFGNAYRSIVYTYTGPLIVHLLDPEKPRTFTAGSISSKLL